MIKLICGKPGVGKTTLLALEASKALKKGLDVYSNVHILGCKKLDLNWIGKYQLENCLIIIDEAQLYYNNRDFKSFKKEWADWFTLHRHYVTNLVIASQDFSDIDIKIRRLAQKIIIVQPTLIFWCIKTQDVSINLGPNEDKTDIVTTYEFNKIKTRWYRKKPAWKYFDSFERVDFPPIPIKASWGDIKKLKNNRYKGIDKRIYKVYNYIMKLINRRSKKNEVCSNDG